MKKKILIIDDDKKLCDLLIDYLTPHNYNVFYDNHPQLGIETVFKLKPNVIILDIMLPDIDGFEVCKRIRKKSMVPIIMLTARGEVMDRIVGLEIGADDYLPKPFEPRELLARIQSILRRSNGSDNESVKNFKTLEIDYKQHSIILDDKPVELTTSEFAILEFFSKNPQVVISRNDIYEKIKGIDDDTFERSIDVLISRLRNKLHDDPKKPRFIKTIWGSGYKFIGE